MKIIGLDDSNPEEDRRAQLIIETG